MHKIEIEINPNLYVEFYGDKETIDESFGHAFGIEKRVFESVLNPEWDKSAYSYAENQIIATYLAVNHYKICEMLNCT